MTLTILRPFLLILLTHFLLQAQNIKNRLMLNQVVFMDFNLLKAGEYIMGADTSDQYAHPIEKPQHNVSITQSFYMGSTPVTVGQFKAFVDETGYRTEAEYDGKGGHGYNADKNKFEGLFPTYNWKFTGWSQTDQFPVVNVSINDARKFCEWASRKTAKDIRLPTEEEWEYSCKAGTKTRFFTGDSPNSLEGYANVFDDALREQLSEAKPVNRTYSFNDGYAFTAPVGQFKPNPWGLYDMIGNVYQLCENKSVANEGEQSPYPVKKFIARGGSYNSGPEFSRSTLRGNITSSSKYAYIGFRVIYLN